MRYLSFGFIGAAALMSCQTLAADLRSQMERCAAEQSDLARLICYDEIARDLELSHGHLRTDPAFARPRPGPQPSSRTNERRVNHRAQQVDDSAPVNFWHLIEVGNAGESEVNLVNSANIDDRMDRVISLDAHPDARLVVQCHKEQWSVFIDWDRRLGRGTGSVTLEWDGQPPERLPVRIQSLDWGGEARGDRSTRFADTSSVIDRLLEHQNLTVRALNDIETTLVARFELPGLKEAIPPLANTCGPPG